MKEAEKLLEYADHKGRCNVFRRNTVFVDKDGRRACTCGYAEALAAYNDAVAKMMELLAEANEKARLQSEHCLPIGS